jgi:hypothetical protein
MLRLLLPYLPAPQPDSIHGHPTVTLPRDKATAGLPLPSSYPTFAMVHEFQPELYPPQLASLSPAAHTVSRDQQPLTHN